jgi:deoxycytidine triphosphate deaminase
VTAQTSATEVPPEALSSADLRALDEAEAATTPQFPGWAERPPRDTLTRWYWEDPEPDFNGMITSDRILAYHYKVGRMIRPLQLQHLKPASYELTLGPLYVMNGEQGVLTEDDRELIIPSNSLAFVSMREQLCMPHWLAGRFDLAINFIYQGLLLGTGPQVDPGFQGVLSCPLHNISDGEIRLTLGQPFAKMDFVKTSFGFGKDVELPQVTSDLELREKRQVPGYEGNPLKIFGADKTFRMPILFAPDRNPRRIKSSLRGLDFRVSDTEESVRRTRNFSVAGAVAVLALLGTLFAGAVGGFVYSLTYIDGRVDDARVVPTDIQESVQDLEGSVDRLERQNAALCAGIRQLAPRRPAPSGC